MISSDFYTIKNGYNYYSIAHKLIHQENFLAQLTGVVEYTYCISVEICHGYDTKPSDGENSVWSFGECGVALHCFRFQVRSDPE